MFLFSFLVVIAISLLDIYILHFLKRDYHPIYEELGRPSPLSNSPSNAFYMMKFYLWFGFMRHKLQRKLLILCFIQSLLGWLLFIALFRWLWLIW